MTDDSPQQRNSAHAPSDRAAPHQKLWQGIVAVAALGASVATIWVAFKPDSEVVVKLDGAAVSALGLEPARPAPNVVPGSAPDETTRSVTPPSQPVESQPEQAGAAFSTNASSASRTVPQQTLTTETPLDAAVRLPSPEVALTPLETPRSNAAPSEQEPRLHLMGPGSFRLYETVAAQVCGPYPPLRFKVAKSGSRAGDAIYAQLNGKSHKITIGETFELGTGCRLRLDATGKTAEYFATFTYDDSNG